MTRIDNPNNCSRLPISLRYWKLVSRDQEEVFSKCFCRRPLALALTPCSIRVSALSTFSNLPPTGSPCAPRQTDHVMFTTRSRRVSLIARGKRLLISGHSFPFAANVLRPRRPGTNRFTSTETTPEKPRRRAPVFRQNRQDRHDEAAQFVHHAPITLAGTEPTLTQPNHQNTGYAEQATAYNWEPRTGTEASQDSQEQSSKHSTRLDTPQELPSAENDLYLTQGQLSDQLDLLSPVDVLRQHLFGAGLVIRSRVHNERVARAQPGLIPERSKSGKRRARPSLEDWFASFSSTADTVRLRLGDNVTRMVKERADIGWDEVDLTSFQHESHASEHGFINGVQQDAMATELEKAPAQDRERILSTLTADLIRFQIRACRSPDDILRVMSVSLRPLSGKPGNASLLSTEREDPPQSTNGNRVSNPAAHYFAGPSIQHAIAASLTRPPLDREYRTSDRSGQISQQPNRNLPQGSAEAPFEAQRVLACLNTLLRRFRTHDPPLPIEFPIIEVALRTAARSHNYAALRLWLGILNEWKVARANPSTSSEAELEHVVSRTVSIVVRTLRDALFKETLKTKEVRIEPRDAAALCVCLRDVHNHIVNDDWITRRAYVELLGACREAGAEMLAQEAGNLAILKAFFRPLQPSPAPPREGSSQSPPHTAEAARSERGKHREDVREMLTAHVNIAADVVAGLLRAGSLGAAWKFFRKVAFSPLFGLRNAGSPVKAQPEQVRGRRHLYSAILGHFERGGGMPSMRLPPLRQREFEHNLAMLLEQKLRPLEEQLGVQWVSDGEGVPQHVPVLRREMKDCVSTLSHDEEVVR